MYQHIKVPAQGQKITVNADMSLNVPDEPIVPYIEGDGTGLDITPVMLKVVDASVEKAYAWQAQDPLDGGFRGRESRPRCMVQTSGCLKRRWRRSGSMWCRSKAH